MPGPFTLSPSPAMGGSTSIAGEAQPPAGDPVSEAGSDPGKHELAWPGACVLAHMLRPSQPDAVVSPHPDALSGRLDGGLFHLAVPVAVERVKARRSGTPSALRVADELRRLCAGATPNPPAAVSFPIGRHGHAVKPPHPAWLFPNAADRRRVADSQRYIEFSVFDCTPLQVEGGEVRACGIPRTRNFPPRAKNFAQP